MTKITATPILKKEALPDAPDEEWFDRTLEHVNSFNEPVARILKNGVTVSDNTPYKIQSYNLVHGVETEIVPPLPGGMSCAGVFAMQCDGLSLDSTTQKPTGAVYSLGLASPIKWRPSGKPSGSVYVTANYAGSIGEHLQASVSRGAGIALTTTVDVVVASITVPPGTWDITALAGYAGLTTATFAEMSISTTSSHTGNFGMNDVFGPANSGGGDAFLSVPVYTVSPSVSTVYNMICDATFSASSSPRAYGRITAVRTGIDPATTGRVKLFFYGE